MDSTRFDGLAREIHRARSRRGTLAAALALSLAVVLPAAANHRVDEPPRRRSACQARCGGEKRMCRAECRRLGAFRRECSRLCKVTRDGCFLRCEFRPLRSRFVKG